MFEEEEGNGTKDGVWRKWPKHTHLEKEGEGEWVNGGMTGEPTTDMQSGGGRGGKRRTLGKRKRGLGGGEGRPLSLFPDPLSPLGVFPTQMILSPSLREKREGA